MVSNSYFNKQASEQYKRLSSSERENLEGGPDEEMTRADIKKRARRIFKHIQAEVEVLQAQDC